MKELLVQTENVKAAQKALSYLLRRPKSEMVGLGLIYGAPGLGKSRFALRTAFQNGYIYLRLDATMTQKAFLTRLLKSLQYRLSRDFPIRGDSHKLYGEIIELLNEYPDIVIFIDEVDYAFKKRGLLGSIRDLVDDSQVTIMLFGMQDARMNLLKANAHYFDRCNYFVEFKPLSLADTAAICSEAGEVKMSDDVVEWIHKNSKGTVRKMMKLLDYVEMTAKERGLKEVGVGDVE